MTTPVNYSWIMEETRAGLARIQDRAMFARQDLNGALRYEVNQIILAHHLQLIEDMVDECRKLFDISAKRSIANG